MNTCLKILAYLTRGKILQERGSFAKHSRRGKEPRSWKICVQFPIKEMLMPKRNLVFIMVVFLLAACTPVAATNTTAPAFTELNPDPTETITPIPTEPARTPTSSPLTSTPVTMIPIGGLTEHIGNRVAIEGTATMYTGGFYAGDGSVKFYLEDETGGVQVWVPGGEGSIDVSIGARLRVYGKLSRYHGALQLVVDSPADVEFLAGSEDDPAPSLTSLADATGSPELAGRLIQVEGIVARHEESNYGYEVDLAGEDGSRLSLYIDKLTGINTEPIETGQRFRVIGILDIYDTTCQLYPRLNSDLSLIHPPELAIEMDAPRTAAPGETIQVTLTAFNYTPFPLTGLIITATLPYEGIQFISASDGGDVQGRKLVWLISDLAGEGAGARVSFQISATAEDGFLAFQDYAASATEWPEPALGEPSFVFIGDTVPIWAIQGPGSRSPYLLETLATAGTVTGIFPELGGFWIQESASDTDPLTSSGLFIHTVGQDIPITAGDVVNVSGIIHETYHQTQLWVESSSNVTILKKGSPLPPAVELDPPADEIQAGNYYESLEGMLVQVSGAGVAVGPTSRYGEYVLVLAKHGVDRLWQGDMAHNGLAIVVDDGSAAVHENSATLPYAVNAGDQVSGLVGPLAFTFGRYKIEPITLPQVAAAEMVLPALTPTEPGEFSILTWNVENLFDSQPPHPNSPAMPTPEQYDLALTKVANTILAAGAPIIIGLQEVENIGVLKDIANHEVLAEYNYQPLLIEGSDSRYIDVGFLVRGDAQVVDVRQYNAPGDLTSRPPLLIQAEIQTASVPVQVFVINNHFTSMSGGEDASEPRRIAQAEWNVNVMNQILEVYPDAYLAVIGDLNAFYNSAPLDILRAAGQHHVFETDPQAGWYTYVYQGLSQTLDHILVTGNLFNLIQRVEVLHVNTDFALPDAGDISPLRKSDHDPVVAVFSVK